MKGRWFTLATLAVIAVDAALLWAGVIGPAAAVALFLAVEIPLGMASTVRLVRVYRSKRRALSRSAALGALIADDPLLRLAASELRTLASLARWIARRPDVPAGATPVDYWRGSMTVPLTLAAICLLEIVAMHLLIPWPVVRLVVDLLGVYGLITVLGWAASRVVRPHLLHRDRLELRHGIHRCGGIPLARVASVLRERHLPDDGTEIPGVFALPGPDGTGTTITLTDPVHLAVPGWPWSRPRNRPVIEVRLHLDEPQQFSDALGREARTSGGQPS